MKRLVVGLLIAAGCGDDRLQIEIFEPTSGTRLRLEQYQFDDGTRQVQPTAYYDTRLHARCTPQRWIDDVQRCVPDAEQALYTDAACTLAIGVGLAIKFPTHFVAYDVAPPTATPPTTERLPARAWAVGPKTDPVAEYYLRAGADCTGPFVVPVEEDTEFYELAGEVGGLVPLVERELGDGRLGLVVRESEDGLRVPLGFRDRELDAACAPAPRGATSGPGVCEPLASIPAAYFGDDACTQPVVVVPDGTEPLALASTRDANGCAELHAIGAMVSTPVYRRQGTTCLWSSTTGQRVFAVGPSLPLAPVERIAEDAPGRRLQRIVASDGALHVHADRLLDTAMRAECRLVQVGDELRCLPTALAPVVPLYAAGCALELRLAEVPARSCEPLAFAALDLGETIELHAIGDAFTGTAYQLDGLGGCRAYTPSAGTVLHTVGPVLPPETFTRAVAFGAR